MTHVSRYPPLLVSLHWVLAVLIVAALMTGFFGLAAMPNSDIRKIDGLRLHMAGGMLILGLMVMRFVVRILTSRPADVTTGEPLLDRMAPISHYGSYALILLMVGSGFATAISAGLPDIVFGGSGAPLPPTFVTYPIRVVHGHIGALLAVFIVVHVIAACYHQFVRKDGPFRRMFFGRRLPHPSGPAE